MTRQTSDTAITTRTRKRRKRRRSGKRKEKLRRPVRRNIRGRVGYYHSSGEDSDDDDDESSDLDEFLVHDGSGDDDDDDEFSGSATSEEEGLFHPRCPSKDLGRKGKSTADSCCGSWADSSPGPSIPVILSRSFSFTDVGPTAYDPAQRTTRSVNRAIVSTAELDTMFVNEYRLMTARRNKRPNLLVVADAIADRVRQLARTNS